MGLTEDRRNLLGLYLARFGGHLLSLLLFPYLARALGPEGFGYLAYAQSLGTYGATVLDLGTGLAGERTVAQERGTGELRRVAWRVYLNRALLGGMGLFLLGVAGSFAPLGDPLLKHSVLFALAASFVNMAFPGPILVGLEKQRYAALAGLAHQGALLLVALLWVQGPEDLTLYLQLHLLLTAANALLGLVWMAATFGPPVWELRGVGAWIWNARHLYLFGLLAQVYTSLAPAFLFHLSGPREAATYAVAEKVLKGVMGLWGGYFALVPPKLAYAAKASPSAFGTMVAGYKRKALGFGLALSLFLLALSFALPHLLGEGYGDAAPSLALLALVPPLVTYSNLLGLGVAFAQGRDSLLLLAIAVGALLFTLSCVLCCPRLGSLGGGVALLQGELGVALFLHFGLRRLRKRGVL